MAIPPVRSAGDPGHIQDHNDIRTELTTRLPLTGGTLTGTLNGTSAVFSGTVSASTPTANSHLATKQYVDQNSGLTGASKILLLSATVTPTDIVPWYGAVFPAGSFAANNGWNTKYAFFMQGITLPAGEFSSTPYLVISHPGRTTNNVNSYALSTTSVFVTYMNFEGISGTNTGITIGPAPHASVQSDTIKLMVIAQ